MMDANSDIIKYRESCIKLVDFTPPEQQGDPRYMEYHGYKIIRRSDGRWQANFTMNGDRKYIYAKTQRECYDKLKHLLNHSKTVQTVSSSYKLHEWLDYWLKTYKQDRRSQELDSAIRTIKRTKVRNIDLKKITVNYLQELINSIKTSRTRVTVYTLLNMALDKAVDNELIKVNYMTKIDKPKHVKEPGKALTYEAEHELIQLLQGEECRDVILFYLYSGCRRGEALKIKRKDVDFEENTLHIPGTKTAGSDRVIPLFPQLRPLIKRSLSPNEYLFKFKADTLTHIFTRLMPGYTIKDLRTTFATRMHENGIPGKYIQKWMGHTSMLTTEKNYLMANNDIYEKQLLEQLSKKLLK